MVALVALPLLGLGDKTLHSLDVVVEPRLD